MASRITGVTPVAVVAIAAASFVSNSVQAQPAFTMGWTVGNADTVTYDWTQFGTLYGNGDWNVPGSEAIWSGWNYSGTLVGDGGAWQFDWVTVFSSNAGVAGGGAFVTANIVVTNNDIVNQNFSLLMTLPTGVLGTMNERGSIVGTITDLGGNDATVFAPDGGQIYTPMIDGLAEVPGFLMGDGFSESAGGGFFSNSVGPADFGLPIPVAASQDVDSSIGILLSFVLTAGDAASFTAIFEVVPVPGPAGLPILAAAGLFAGRKRRRR